MVQWFNSALMADVDPSMCEWSTRKGHLFQRVAISLRRRRTNNRADQRILRCRSVVRMSGVHSRFYRYIVADLKEKTKKTIILRIILRCIVANPSRTSVRSSVVFLFSALFGAIDRLYVGLILGLPPTLSYIRYVDPRVARIAIHIQCNTQG